MESSANLFNLPQRVSLPMQVAAAMRRAIEAGVWNEYLPSERRLLEIFQVSRPSIRGALRILAKEGLLTIRHGRRNRLTSRPRAGARPVSRLVGLVTHQPISTMHPTSYKMISEIRTQLTEHGFSSEILLCLPNGSRAQLRKIEQFLEQYRVLCCVLVSVNRELQLWFARHSVPVLVLGSCHAGVALPSIDVHYRSVCRHAATTFLRKGHRRMALFVRDFGMGGDLASEQGFREGVEQWRPKNVASALIVRYNGTARNLVAKLDELFNSPDAPTALLVADPLHVYLVYIHLLKRGIPVPQRVSLISRDSDFLFDLDNPMISHYKDDNDAFGRRLSRLMLKLVNHRSLPLEPSLILPNYYDGGTVQRPG